MELTIMGFKYEPTVEQLNYVKIKKEYEELAKNISIEYFEMFEEKYSDVKQVISDGVDFLHQYFEKAIEYSLTKLSESKIYTYGKEDLISKCKEKEIIDFYINEFEDIKDEFLQITNEADSERLYRELRKESRGKFVGGGFGVEGAIKGAATAGAMNIVTGMTHSFFNFIGNTITASSENKKKELLFKAVGKRLSSSLFDSIRYVYFVMMDIFSKEGKLKFKLPSNEENKKSNALFENLSSGRIPEDEQPTIIYEILKINPYDPNFYEWIISNYGDQDNEVENFAKTFGIDVHSMKIYIIDDPINQLLDISEDIHQYDLNNNKLEEEILELKEKTKNLKELFGITEKIDSEEKIEKILQKIAESSRKIDGVVYSSNEEYKNVIDDTALFYDYISLHGIDQPNTADEIRKLNFKSDIILKSLDEKLEKLSNDSNPSNLSKCIWDLFEKNCFYDLTVNSNIDKKNILKQIFINGYSEEYNNVLLMSKSFVEYNDNEIVPVIIRSKDVFGKTYYWIIISNAKICLVKEKNGQCLSKEEIKYIDVKDLSYKKNGDFIVTSKDGKMTYLNIVLSGIDHSIDDGFEELTKTIMGVFRLLSPITCGRENKLNISTSNKSESNEIKHLNITKYNEQFSKVRDKCYDEFSDSKLKKFDDHVGFPDVSPNYPKLLKDMSDFIGQKFENEDIYLVIADGYVRDRVYEGLVITSKYFYYKLESIKTTIKLIELKNINRFCIEGFMQNTFLYTNTEKLKLNLYSIPDVAKNDLVEFISTIIKDYKSVCIKTDDNILINSQINKVEKEIKENDQKVDNNHSLDTIEPVKSIVKFCGKCGAQRQNGAQFCTKCGYKFQ